MSAMGQDQPQGPPQAPMVPEDVETVRQAILRAIRKMAESAAMAQDAREVKEYGAAAKDFGDAWVVLDPTLDEGGVPLAHHLELEDMRLSAAAEARARQDTPSTMRQDASS